MAPNANGAVFGAVVLVLCDEDRELAASVVAGLRLLEDDALGGGGSRGSGRVRFDGLRLAWRSAKFYSHGEAESVLMEGGDTAALQSTVTDSEFSSKLS